SANYLFAIIKRNLDYFRVLLCSSDILNFFKFDFSVTNRVAEILLSLSFFFNQFKEIQVSSIRQSNLCFSKKTAPSTIAFDDINLAQRGIAFLAISEFSGKHG